jgi:hypothetical protein
VTTQRFRLAAKLRRSSRCSGLPPKGHNESGGASGREGCRRFESESVLSACDPRVRQEGCFALTESEEMKLGKNEFYKCPFRHVHPRHKQAFFKDFDANFRILVAEMTISRSRSYMSNSLGKLGGRHQRRATSEKRTCG